MILSIMLWFCMGDILVGHCAQSANYAPLQNGATQGIEKVKKHRENSRCVYQKLYLNPV